MKTSRYSDSQIMAILKQAEAGTRSVAEGRIEDLGDGLIEKYLTV